MILPNDFQVDSNFTLDENLADNVGHKIAYQVILLKPN